jgi:hypothetical protein
LAIIPFRLKIPPFPQTSENARRRVAEPLLRWVQVDGENGMWYVTSAVGGFRIDPDKAFSGALQEGRKPDSAGSDEDRS